MHSVLGFSDRSAGQNTSLKRYRFAFAHRTEYEGGPGEDCGVTMKKGVSKKLKVKKETLRSLTATELSAVAAGADEYQPSTPCLGAEVGTVDCLS